MSGITFENGSSRTERKATEKGTVTESSDPGWARPAAAARMTGTAGQGPDRGNLLKGRRPSGEGAAIGRRISLIMRLEARHGNAPKVMPTGVNGMATGRVTLKIMRGAVTFREGVAMNPHGSGTKERATTETQKLLETV